LANLGIGVFPDEASRVRKIGLIGDAAFCPSLLAGQGAALAMIAAYVLAGELGRVASQPKEAFRRYEQQLQPFIQGKQNAAAQLASSFAPKTRLGVFLLNQITKVFKLPFVAKFAMGPSLIDLIDLIDLPGYPVSGGFRS
jgi:2-polyprenyl-6-methoxyphenol hydroxylase-like FAD-dependent oxidoreductase